MKLKHFIIYLMTITLGEAFTTLPPPVRSDDDRIVRVSIHSLPPTVFHNDKREPQGMIVDLLNEIAFREKWKLEYFMDEWIVGLKRLETGDLDLKVSIAYSQERDRIFDFSNEPIYLDWGVVVVHDPGIQNILDLKERRVAITAKGFFQREFKALCRKFNVDPLYIYHKTDDHVMAAVQDKQVDAGVIPHMFSVLNARKYHVKKSPIIFAPTGVFFAVPEGKNRNLLKVIDRYLEDWKKDPDSFYYNAMNRWFHSEKIRSVIPQWLIITLVAGVGFLIILFLWIGILNSQIKERKKAEDALQASKAFLNTVFDSIQDGISVLDSDMNILQVNRVMNQWYPGISNMIGRKCFEVFHGRDAPCNMCPTIRTLESGQMEMQEVALVTGDKETGVLELFSFPILDVSGSITGVVEIVRNITERKNDEKEKEKLIEKLQKSLDEIKTLKGILPICAHCKNIRDDKGYWKKIESYIEDHSEADFTHGICPDCAKKLYSDISDIGLEKD